MFHSRLSWREWVPAVAMTAGLAGLLYFLASSSGHAATVRWYVWVIAIGVNLAAVGTVVAVARRTPAGAGGGDSGGLFIALAVLSGLVMAAAVVWLARSPLLSGPGADQEEAAPKAAASPAGRRR